MSASYRRFAEVVVQQRGPVEGACLLQKAHACKYGRQGKQDIFPIRAARVEFLVYLCILAEEMGFGIALEAWEMVWMRGIVLKKQA